MALLEVQDIQVYYGMIQALKGVSFSVNEGEVIALIGANGAGKTTTLHTVTGLLRAKSGHIIYDGQDITKVPPHKIVTMGMAHVPEGRRVFANMTVLQNLKMGAFTRSDKNEIDATIEKVYKRFPRLKERQNQTAGTLSGGEQQMLAMGRALMSQPKIILMDEPSMGLSPIFVNEIFDIIKEVRVEQRFFWLSRMRRRLFLLLTELMSLRPEGLHWKVRQVIFFMMNLFRKLILESKQEGFYGEFCNYHCETVWKRRTYRR